MGKLTKLNKDLFNLKNIKEVIKKSVQVAGLTSALFMGSLGLAGCQHDISEKTTTKQPTDQCTICDDIQEEPCGILHVCDDEKCLDHNEEAQKNGHIHDYCDEQECADKKVTDKDHQHDYCKEPGCDDIDGKEHGHCTDEDCDYFGEIYDDYAKEHGTDHTYPVEDQCGLCGGLQTEPCGVKHICDDPECLNYPEGKTYPEGHVHDYCDEQDCANIIVSDKDHVHDYCVPCLGNQTKEHGHCTDEACEHFGKIYDDYAKEHGDAHDYCPADNCNENHVHNYCNDDENCLGTDKTSPDHTHDYCNTCDGNQTDPKHTCSPEPTLSAEVESIGNGTYSIANFMVNDNADDSIDQKVADGLECAEKYIKGLTEEFSNDFKTKYASLITSLQNDETYNQDTTSGFDPLINILNINSAPIFEEIIENIDDNLDVAYFKNEYKGLSLKTYKDASGNYFDGNPAQDTYNTKKDSLNKAWAMMHALNSIDQEFSIVEDIENNKCIETTSHMDELLLKHDIANDLDISKDDLKNFINLSLTITSLDAMHDYAIAKGYSKHVITSCDGLDNELTK